MSVVNLEEHFETIPPTLDGWYDFCKANPNMKSNLKPYGEGSWRGAYDLPCVFFAESEDSQCETKLSDWMEFLDNLLHPNYVLYGYKGGEWSVNRHDELHLEPDTRSCYGETSCWDLLIIEE